MVRTSLRKMARSVIFIQIDPKYGGGRRVVAPASSAAHGGLIAEPGSKLAYWAASLDAQLATLRAGR